MSQRNIWIDSCGAPRWQITGQKCGDNQRNRDERKRNCIDWFNVASQKGSCSYSHDRSKKEAEHYSL
jgi:hypothetical protein